MTVKERFEKAVQSTGQSKELLEAFADYVNERAIELMVRDNKVEGKHYAAMKLVLGEAGVKHNLT